MNQIESKIDFSDRHTYVGASEIAAVLGMNPYRTPLDVYLEKTGETTPPDLTDNQAVHFGNVLEEVVADEFTRRTSLEVRRDNRNFSLESSGVPLRGHIDRKLTGQKVGLECKTANIRIAKSFGESGTDDVPMHYLLQCIGYLALTGWEKWHLAVLIGGNDFRNYTIERDEKAIALVIEQIKQFWDCVEQRQPPPPLNSNDLRLLYPDSTGATIVATTDIAQAVQELKHLTSQEKQITGLKKAQQQLIQGFMEDAGTLSNPDGTIAATWRSSTSNRIDTKSLKEAHPNMAAEFTKQSTSRRFLVK